MASVTLQGVTKRFGEVLAVSNLSIEVQDREFLVLVGPAGCGKSTTLRLIAGLEELSEGNIYIGDRLVNDVAPKDRDIAMVFQSYALYPHMSVYDNLAFGLRLRKTPKKEIERRVQEAAELLAIGELLDRKPKQLSGGQRQRVALGRAIVREPKCFLMDEPLSNLDAKLRVQTRAELIRLHERLQTTVIYVTHDQTEAMTMGSRIAVLRDGVLQQIGAPQIGPFIIKTKQVDKDSLRKRPRKAIGQERHVQVRSSNGPCSNAKRTKPTTFLTRSFLIRFRLCVSTVRRLMLMVSAIS